jgi:hypothetical protein
VTLGFGPSVCGVGGVLLLRRQFLWCSVLMVFGCVLCFRLLVLRWGHGVVGVGDDEVGLWW